MSQEPKIKTRLPRSKKSSYGPLSAILVTLGIYIGAQVLAALAIGLFATFNQVDRDITANLISGSVYLQFLFIFLVGILSMYILWLFLGWRKISWRDIGVRKPRLKQLWYALPAYGVYFLLALLALVLIRAFLPGIDLNQPQQIGFESARTAIELTLVFISLVLIPSVVEEILIRGYLYGGLVKKFSKWIAALVASGIFAVAHLQFGTSEPLVWVAAIDTFILSMVLIWLREKTGNVWAGVIVHMIKNSIAFAGLFILRFS